MKGGPQSFRDCMVPSRGITTAGAPVPRPLVGEARDIEPPSTLRRREESWVPAGARRGGQGETVHAKPLVYRFRITEWGPSPVFVAGHWPPASTAAPPALLPATLGPSTLERGRGGGVEALPAAGGGDRKVVRRRTSGPRPGFGWKWKARGEGEAGEPATPVTPPASGLWWGGIGQMPSPHPLQETLGWVGWMYVCSAHPRGQVTAKDKNGNDPSAGSPTETLLRLLLPLDSQV